MHPKTSFQIASIAGDGIGPDVIAAARAVLAAASAATGGFELTYEDVRAGAACYRDTGEDMGAQAFETAKAADAILLGAIGLPDIRFPDGTEISPHLRLRDELRLFAGVRPVKAFPNTPRKLLDPRASEIDFVILRESTEGLFYSHGKGEVSESEARDTLRITRAVSEDLFDFGFALAAKRKQRGKKGELVCVDKANVFRSMAFFRKIYDERAARHPNVATAYNYVDAQALDLIRRPWDFDVLVMENMFGDILSDLGGGLVGGMGMAPCAEIGLEHGLFQPAHGSAPDIAGQGIANPTATILSAAMMLDWLGERHDVRDAVSAAALIDAAVWRGFERERIRPVGFGGDGTTQSMTKGVLESITELVSEGWTV